MGRDGDCADLNAKAETKAERSPKMERSPQPTRVSVGRRRLMRAQSLDGVLEESSLTVLPSSAKADSRPVSATNQRKRPFYRSQTRKIFLTTPDVRTGSGNCLDPSASVIILREPQVRRMSADGLEDLEEDDEEEEETEFGVSFRTAIVTANNAADDAGKSRRSAEEEGGGGTRRRRGKKKGGNRPNYCTRHKLERGTLSAFKREARNIIERDLPYVSHADNIIRIFKDKSQTRLVAAATKSGSAVHRTVQDWAIRLKYFFQHPYLRLAVCYSVIACNFLMFAEDPVSHSKKEADIPVMGNVFSFIFTKYPPDWRWTALKVVMWLLAVVCGLVVGKTIIHGIILSRLLRLKMFRADQGSWMVQFFTVILSLFLFSHAYNVFLVLTFPSAKAFTITSEMYLTTSTVMKTAACGTWLGGILTALIVTDMMLQDNLYPSFAPTLRKYWRSNAYLRIGLFWSFAIVITVAVITIIVTDWIQWDNINRGIVSSTELTRAFLASFILVLDLTIVMQDWDFPHFTNTLDVKLPGWNKHEVNFSAVELKISGKWFNYGIIFLVMLFDLNMWKNQIFYSPSVYGQYVVSPRMRVHTVTNQTVLQAGEPWFWSAEARSLDSPTTGRPFMEDDLTMHSRYLGLSMSTKSMAFIPCMVGFLVFFVLIGAYGRIHRDGPAGDGQDDKEEEEGSADSDAGGEKIVESGAKGGGGVDAVAL